MLKFFASLLDYVHIARVAQTDLEAAKRLMLENE